MLLPLHHHASLAAAVEFDTAACFGQTFAVDPVWFLILTLDRELPLKKEFDHFVQSVEHRPSFDRALVDFVQPRQAQRLEQSQAEDLLSLSLSFQPDE